MARFCKIFYLLLFLSVSITAQYDNPSIYSGQSIKFEHLTVEQGLSNNNVMCILKDKQGYLWIGTHDGLNKYDGYKFTIYRNDPADSLSISSNWITSLYEDRAGMLWVATKGGGLNKFDREKEKFIHYKYDRNNPSGISAVTIERTAEFRYGDKNVLWIGTFNGLNKMDIASEKFTHYPHVKKGIPSRYVEAMVVDSLGFVWVGSSGDGLHKFDPKKEIYTHYRHDPLNSTSLSSNKIMSLYLDKSGILWVGTRGGGLNKFDQKTEQFIHYRHNPKNAKSLSSNHIWSICEDQSGMLWVGTNDEGLNRFDPETGLCTHFKHDPGNPNSLRTNFIRFIYQDNTDILWIGTLHGGLHKYNPQIMQFTLDPQKISFPDCLLNTSVSSIYETNHDKKNILWIGTISEGLYKFDRESGQLTNYQHDPNNSNSLSSNIITYCLEFTYGGRRELWISTFNGLNKFNPQSGQFTRYYHDSENPYSISSNLIRTLFEDKNGVLWIGTQNGGINKFNYKTERFSHLGPKLPITQIYEDKSGTLWITAWIGLRKIDRDSGNIITYMRNRDVQNYADLNRTNTIHQSHFAETDKLWTGTFSGLNKFDPKTGEFINYSVKDGLPNNVIQGILEDNHGNLWLSTNKGLSKFDPKTDTFRNYDVHDGLVNSQFNCNTYFKNKDGELFFGGTNGLDAFNPENVKDNTHIPRIVITDFKIFNESVKVNKKDGDFSFPKHISALEKIELSYKHTVFSFEFAALDYHSPPKNKYAYRMEGVDPDWVYTDATRRFATYTNLDPGEYVFRVKGSNNDGIWNKEGTSVKIIIIPPWWKTNLAYFIYIIFFGFSLYLLWYFQMKRIKVKHALEMEHIQAEKYQEIDRLKSHFFENISHEFRTPLTLILSPIEQLIKRTFKGNIEEGYVSIRSNAKKLLRLVNQLLSLSKLEAGQIKLQVGEQDIIPVFNRIVNLFSSLAESKQIEFNFNSPESLAIYFDEEKIETILNNLLSNAFKFTPEGGVVEVAVSKPTPPSGHPSKEGNKKHSPLSRGDLGVCESIEIKISNTGPHIPANQLEKIFDRFYQIESKNHIEGTGIGLSLTKDLVKLHHGQITVESKPRGKTTFTIIIPTSKESYQEDEFISAKAIDSPLLKGVRGMLESEIYTTEVEGDVLITQKPESKNLSVILMVEDNEEVRNYLRKNLQEKYNIIEAPNGKIGLQNAEKYLPDLIISDVMMPEMDGFEFCEKVKTEIITSHIPVILLTARATKEDKLEGLKTGADDYLPKPFDLEELFVRIENLIQQRRGLKQRFLREALFGLDNIISHPAEQEFINKISHIINQNIDNPEYTVEKFAKDIGMSRSHFFRKIKTWTNQSPQEFIRTCRLKKAAVLLKNKSKNVTETAFAVGFKDVSHFTHSFKNQFGETPKDFINNN